MKSGFVCVGKRLLCSRSVTTFSNPKMFQFAAYLNE